MDLFSFLHHIQSQPAWLLLPSALGLLSIFNLTTSLLKHLYTFFFRPPKNLLLYGSWAFITGSTDGIGKSLAFQLAQKGLHLILLGRNPDKLKQVSTEMHARFKQTQIRTVVVDLAGDLTAGVERIRKEIEGLEVGLLINCAGYGDRLRRFHEIDDEALRRSVKVNVEGLTKVTQVVLKGMLERNRGAIVNIGSGSSVVRPSLPLFAVYAATKAYVEQFSRSLHVEYKRKGIDVQCQIPLFVATKMVPFKRMSVCTPSPDAYAKAAVRWIGYEPFCMPYWPHYIQWCVASLLPDTPTLAWRMRYSTSSSMKRKGSKKE
ncbi:hypothetical protein MRB53_034998 [Persea americana]|uniref:Uncharacterized protein n=1 Tax=Persea americana TaxID=3435 RepID=A0ACC2K3D3_PERAE|nr:hypothetical protein MRB53_034998 [Persea americana]